MNAKTVCDTCPKRGRRCVNGWVWVHGSEYPCNSYLEPVKPSAEELKQAEQADSAYDHAF